MKFTHAMVTYQVHVFDDVLADFSVDDVYRLLGHQRNQFILSLVLCVFGWSADVFSLPFS